MLKELLVSASDRETRICVLEEGRVAEVQIERRKQRGTVGNIYKGRVTRVLPGMQSAFVDIGLERDGFLYVADVGEEVDDFDAFGSGGAAEAINAVAAVAALGAALPNDAAASSVSETGSAVPDESLPRPVLPSIGELLREGQGLVVQVTKDQIAHKGVRVTTHVTLPGRTLVYMPTIDHVGVSRRIENEEERNRLKDILTALKKGPADTSSGRQARPRAGGVRRRPPLPHEALGADPQEGRALRRALAPAPRPRPDAARRARRLRLGLRDALRRRRRKYQRIVEFLDQSSRPRLEGEAVPQVDASLRGVRAESEIENALK